MASGCLCVLWKTIVLSKACWIHYNPLTNYPLQQEIPNISLSFDPNINCIPEFPTCDSCNKNDGIRWLYYFITGSAGTSKSYIINLIINMLKNRRSRFLLLAPTGVSAQTIGGKTIHSELSIVSTQGGFRTCAFTNADLNTRLKKVDTIIIDEVSMVSAELLDFISNMFARIHNNAVPFGGINIIVVGDLVQLPPVTGQPVFHSTVWSLFYPLFLTVPQRQNGDMPFYQILEEVRNGTISPQIWDMLQQRHSEFVSQPMINTLLNTTHIVRFKETAQQINTSACKMLPIPPNKFLLSQASDFVNANQYDPSQINYMFKSKTNSPPFLRLQPDACVMYLNNSLIKHGICNGTIGVITDVDPINQCIRVAFSVKGSIVDIDTNKLITSTLMVAIPDASSSPYKIVSLNIHKTQGLILQKVTLTLDGNIFSWPGLRCT